MEILRVPPYPLVTTWSLPDANYDYIVYVEDLVDETSEETTITSDEDGVVLYELSKDKLTLDRQLSIKFYDDERETVILESTIDVVRPYTNPNDLGETASEIREYKRWELIARSIIDGYTNDLGFYNRKWVLQVSGSNADYLPVWRDANSVLKVYENDVLVYDIDAEDPTTNLYNYKVTGDKSAIYRIELDPLQRSSSSPITLPAAASDNTWANSKSVAFPENYDYRFILDEGPRSLPTDVQYAAEILIDDLKCGRLDYYQKYVTNYDSDQFKIQFDKQMLSGTGNLIVDKILDKYIKSITKVGVL